MFSYRIGPLSSNMNTMKRQMESDRQKTIARLSAMERVVAAGPVDEAE
jgi:hypothetical protein